MKDPVFIKNIRQRGMEAGERVNIEFSKLDLQSLNWKLNPDKWSIGQCLDHLVRADATYFRDLKEITSGKYTMTAWERWSPFSKIFGKMLVNRFQEQVTVKIKAPAIFLPSTSTIDTGIINRFQLHLNTLLEYIDGCNDIDIDRTVITSPVISFVTFSLRNAIRVLIQHEWRHVNQALRVKGMMNEAAGPGLK